MDGSGEITEFRVAQYVRMSTEHQQYSTHNQSDKIREYAEKRGIEIIKTYADDGKSGLSIGGRAALQQLIADVESGAANFNVILVYDVSRWGRFQDADESIRLDQEVFGTQMRSALTKAFAVSMSLRMIATMATFAGFPAARRASYFAFRSGL